MAVPRTSDAESLLESLDPEQREVALALHGPVQVLAGAGTGKTRALTTRVAYGVRTATYDPLSVLAVTFTTKAAAEMRERLDAMGAEGVAVRTFHATALRQVRYFWPRVVGGDVPELMADTSGMVAEASRRQRCGGDLRDLANEIVWAKSSNVAAPDYAVRASSSGRRIPGATADQVADVYADYERLKAASAVWDMDDVLLAAVGLLAEYPEVGDRVRRQYRRVVVDEFQDVSPVQVRLLRLWLGSRDEICVVGDPDQTIYSFAGARSTYLTGFTDWLPGARKVRLWRNYRSTPQIVDTANRVIRVGVARPAELVAQRDPGPPVDIQSFSDAGAQARGIARRVLDYVREGRPLSHTAVLVRSHSQGVPIAEALRAAGVGVVTAGSGADWQEAAPNGVTVATLHAAKGREWPFVVMAGMNDGVLPTRAAMRSSGNDGLAEERRLCYVGMTRARDRLLLTYEAPRDGSGSPPSRFLSPLQAASDRSTAAPRR